MDAKTIMKTTICLEHNDEFNYKWFHYKPKTFVHHVDTLYFLATTRTDDWNKDRRADDFIREIKLKKEQSERLRDAAPIFENAYKGLEVRPFYGARMYGLHFGLQDCFDFFVCEKVPNLKTPPIMVQIRSQCLWLTGLRKSFDMACECLEQVLELFEMEIVSTQENRIDYAYHTNYIQDMINFFPESRLHDMQISHFERWHKEGYFKQDNLIADYFTLGRRKSNNVFFRVYNKTNEVLEMGYKQFFIPMWFDKGLISKFDFAVLTDAFRHKTKESIDKSRCRFYYDYGTDRAIKAEIYDKLRDPDTPTKWYTNMADKLVPKVTIVSNIEFQTKRKFYDRLDLPYISADETYRIRMDSVFNQMESICKFLTHDVIRFVSYKGKSAELPRLDRPYANWWKRLRAAKPLELHDKVRVEYYRKYQRVMDRARQKELSISKMATMAAYLRFEDENGYEVNMNDDFNEFISMLNDNDVHKYYTVRQKKLNELIYRDYEINKNEKHNK